MSELQYHQNVEKLVSEWQEALKPPPNKTVDEWADTKRILPKSGANEAGQWRTTRVPYMREPMRCMSPQSPVQRITMKKGSQVSGTEGGCINPMLYYVDWEPCSILYLQKNLTDVEKFSKQRLAASIQAIPSIAAKIAGIKSTKWSKGSSRESSDATLMKTFPGGALILGGANSAASLASMPIRVLIGDEIDTYEGNVDGEGDPWKLAQKRTATFFQKKIIEVSTPRNKHTSRIHTSFLNGSQEYYNVPCPHCNELQTIEWSRIKGVDAQGNAVEKFKGAVKICLVCEHCGMFIDERHKTWMLAEENGARWIARNPDGDPLHRSFHLNALYSPLGWYSWKDAVKDFLEASKPGKRNEMIVWVNTVLGEVWDEKGRSIEAEELEKHKTSYAAEVPGPVRVLTAGVDVQHDRLEVEIVGWANDRETYSIDYAIFRGNTETNDSVWHALDEYLRRMWKHENGNLYGVACTMVDSSDGQRTKKVYNFCKTRWQRRIFPVKGKEGWGNGHIRRPKRANDDGVWLTIAWVDEIKSTIYELMRLVERGPGFCHFPQDNPMYDEDYFKGLASEQLEDIVDKRKGTKRLGWVLKTGQRNEPLDCRVYAYAALALLSPNFDMITAEKNQTVAPVNPKPSTINRRGRVGTLSPGVRL